MSALNPKGRGHTFVTLDALRGIAAVAVVTLHFREFFFQYSNHAYLAVDFFYMLSGFVLSYAYQPRLDAGWSAASFLRARLVRLYPMYFAGLVGGVAVALLIRPTGSLSMAPVAMLSALAANLLLLPSPGIHAGASLSMYPFDYPAWSLFFESLANVVHALVLRRRSTQTLCVIVALSLGGMVLAHHSTGRLDFGVNRVDLKWGIFRVLLSYCGGMLLYRLWSSGVWRWRLPLLIAPSVLLVVLLIPARIPHVMTFDLLVITLVFPALLLFSASVEPGRALAPACRLLGLLSYPIYVLHVPVAEAVHYGMPRLAAHGLPLHAPWTGLVVLSLTVLIALVLERWYDVPVRNWLRTRAGSQVPKLAGR